MNQSPETPSIHELSRDSALGVPVARPVVVAGPAVESGSFAGDAMALPGMSRRAALLDVCLLAGALVVFELAMGCVVQAVWGPFQPDPEGNGLVIPREVRHAAVVPVIASRAGVAIALIAAALRLRGRRWDSVGATRRNLGENVLIGVLTTACAGFAVFGVMLLLSVLFPELRRQMERNVDHVQDLLPPLGLLGFFPLAVVVGVWEELAFRGFMMTRLRRLTGRWSLAVLISTLAFTAPHAAEQTPAALIAVSLLSLTFSAVTILRRSLVPAIVAHILWNYGQFVIVSQLVAKGAGT